jgi:hypothetical protein
VALEPPARKVGSDHGGRGLLIIGVVDAEVGEGVQGVLPMCAGLLVLVDGVVGVGEPVVGAGLVVGLA